jgi:long-subunit acyl-CoA synthetase (AMP-forming)
MNRLFDEAIKRFPNKEFMMGASRLDLYKKSLDIRERLRARGVGAQDRIGLMAPKDPGWVAAVMACSSMRCVLVPVPETENGRSLLARSATAAIIHRDGAIESSKKKAEETFPARDDALLLYTSGSTSRPKGVLLSAAAVVSNLEAIDRRVGDTILPTDRSFSILPWHHCYGLVCELFYLFHKGAEIVLPSSPDLRGPALVREIRRAGPTVLYTVPRLLEKIRAADRPWLPGWLKKRLFFGPRLRMMSVGGGRCPAEIIRYFDSVLGVPVYQGYGMTETSPMIALNVPGMDREGSVGRPLDGTSVRVDPATGEILVRTPSVMEGYLTSTDPITTEPLDITDDGYLPTGDSGRLDGDGFLFVEGRLRDSFKLTNGKYVHPADVASRLMTIPGVDQALVFPSDDHSCVRCLVFTTGENDLLRRLREKNGIEWLEPYEVPREVLFLDAPLTAADGHVSLKQELVRAAVLRDLATGRIRARVVQVRSCHAFMVTRQQ